MFIKKEYKHITCNYIKDMEDELIKKYFYCNNTVIFWINPCKKSTLLTSLRKIGDKLHRYVTSVRYCDVLSYDIDNCEIFSEQTDESVYSTFHSECTYCKDHKKKVNNNKIIGIKIYPINIFPSKHLNRKTYWKQFK